MIWRIGVVYEAETGDASLWVGDHQSIRKGWTLRIELLFCPIIPPEANFGAWLGVSSLISDVKEDLDAYRNRLQ